jgi:hypothetical protein
LITVDVFFRERETYERAILLGVLTKQSVAAAYGVEEEMVEGVYHWDAACAIKVTMYRTVSAGSVGDEDCYGAGQHVPLMKMAWPFDAVASESVSDTPGTRAATSSIVDPRGGS